MKIIIAPDSFKGALSAEKAAGAFADGWRQVRGEADEVITLPLSDGGEGMAAALCAACGGKYVTLQAHDALRREISVRAVVAGDLAIVESAAANGIELLKNDELNPFAATTFGVGEMLQQLYDAGFRKYLIGIGGSATVDGGAGMLQALGLRIADRDGNILPDGIGGGTLNCAAAVTGLDALEKWHRCRIQIACDVTNVLCGENGSARVFGPQKGARGDMVDALDGNLRHWAELLGDPGMFPSDGAAGGLGFALRHVLHAEMVSGAELVMRYSGFYDLLDGADLVITGEGCSDAQSICGKLCCCVANAAQKQKVPVMLFSGALKGDTSELEKLFDGCFSIAAGPGTLADAIAATEANLRRAGANVARIAGRFMTKKN